MKKILFSFLCLLFSKTVMSQDLLKLEDYLNKSLAQSEQFQALKLSREALASEIQSRDLGLNSELVFNISDTDDKKDALINNRNRRSLSRLYSLGLEKQFITGTTAQLDLAHEEAKENTFTATPMLYRSDWQVSLSQQLWGNAFGHGTRLLQKSNTAELQSRDYDLILRQQQLIAQFEEKYWDLAYLYKQYDIQKENIKRSEQILNWTRKRVSMSAALDTDLLQAQALLSTRQLDMADIENQLERLWIEFKTILPEIEIKSWRPDSFSLAEERDTQKLIFNSKSTSNEPSKLETLSAQYRLQQLQAQTQAIREAVAPTLELTLAHGRNGVRDDFQDSLSRAGGNETIFNEIGLVLTVDLDLDLNLKQKKALQLQEKSAALEAQRLNRQNQLEWQDLNRQLISLKSQLKLAQELEKFQKQKSEQQRRFYQQGRSTIFQAISFEVEAADAELRVYRILNSIRKTESQARLFGYDQGEG